MPLIVDSFGKNIYVNNEMIGYIGRNVLFVNCNKFADISDNGIISYGDHKIGYVDDDNTIYVGDKEVGYIDDKNNFIFYHVLGGK